MRPQPCLQSFCMSGGLWTVLWYDGWQMRIGCECIWQLYDVWYHSVSYTKQRKFGKKTDVKTTSLALRFTEMIDISVLADIHHAFYANSIRTLSLYLKPNSLFVQMIKIPQLLFQHQPTGWSVTATEMYKVIGRHALLILSWASSWKRQCWPLAWARWDNYRYFVSKHILSQDWFLCGKRSHDRSGQYTT